MSNFIDDFLSGLEQDKRTPRSSNNLIKIRMDAPTNQGTIVFAPFMFGESGKFYQFVEDVREYRACSSLYHEGNDETWLKILPKSYYGVLTDEQSKLYDKVSSLFDEVEGFESDFHKIRRRTYSMFQGYVINHVDRDKNQVTDNINKAALLIFPSRNPVDALISTINAKMTEYNGSKDWIPLLFSPQAKGREGVITLNFEKNPTKAGYVTTVGFGFNSSFSKIIGPDTISDDEVAKMTDNGFKSMLSWQTDGDSMFNTRLFEELRDALIVRLNQENADKAVPPESISKPTPATATPNASNPAADILSPKPADNPVNAATGVVNAPF